MKDHSENRTENRRNHRNLAVINCPGNHFFIKGP